MCTICYLLFIACSLIMTNASILNDLQEAQKFVEQLDYDYSAVAADAAAQQRPAAATADLLWYDYGGGGGGGGGISGGGYYGVGGSTVPGTAAVQLIGDADKRGGATQSSAGIWFGPRLGRRKRRGGVVQPVDGNMVGPAGPQEPMVAAAGQPVVGGTWVFVPIIDNTLYGQMKQNVRSGRSSSEDGDDAASASRHAARSPPYSPPFSPRLGRQVTAHGRPQVPRLGRETSLYRRDARSALYQQNASNRSGSLYRLPEQQHVMQQQPSSSSAAVTQSAQATAEARRHAVA